jgi:hypothetical protein
MKNFALFVLILATMVPAVGAQVRPQNLQPANGERTRPAATAAVAPAQTNEQLLLALYMSEFQRQVGINDEQAARFRPLLMQWLNQRRTVVNRRNEALNTLRQMLANGASESELTRQIADVDQADNQTRNSERRLLTQVDPMLTTTQQAKFRLFQVDMEQRIRELVEAVQRGQQPANPRGQQPANPRGQQPANPRGQQPNQPRPRADR